MWQKLANIILRNRLAILIGILCLTVVMGFFARKVELKYEFGGLLPKNDPVDIVYKNFRSEYGQDGLVIVIASNSEDIYELENFQKWYELGEKIKEVKVPVVGGEPGDSVPAIDSVFSEAHLYNLIKNKEEKKFELYPVIDGMPESQEQVDSARNLIHSLPFYSDLVYKPEGNLHMMMVFVNENVFNSKSRGTLVDDVKSIGDEYNTYFGELKYSGLPYIRSVTMNKVKGELSLFVFLALAVTGLLLFLFFRSLKVVWVSLIVVAIGVIWSVGSIALIGYKISILMGLIPPLMIVIGIPNCIYLINKYQQEYKQHGNKAKGLTRVIRKVGNATFLTNATTAMGFGTFVFTHSDLMREFGVIASINILAMFFLSILVVPTVYSYLSGPKEKHMKHLDRKWLYYVVDKLVIWTTRYRKLVYIATVGLLIVGGLGMALMKTSGNIVDDLPKNDQVVKDLKFFESELGGVMPFEILVSSQDTIYKRYHNIKKIDSIQTALREEEVLSRSMSMVDAIKYVTQAYANGTPESYELRDEMGLVRILKSKYFENTFDLADSVDGSSFISGFMDSSHTETRITVQIADIGTDSMEAVVNRVRTRIEGIINAEINLVDSAFAQEDVAARDTILWTLYNDYSWVKTEAENYVIGDDEDLSFEFLDDEKLILQYHDQEGFEEELKRIVEESKLEVNITGAGVIYTEGTTYLVKNLFISLMLAVMVIALLMSFLFRSWRMVLVSLIPNLIPLIFTSAIMGFVGIPIKPSTILVFSIAFGISVDDTIHFLAKYRQELKANSWDIRGSVIKALRETGVSMIYTSIILFFGFSIFIASKFGGTQALGILVSMTLFIAMLANLVLLPSLLLSLEKRLTTKAFKDPLIEIVDEEEDLELEELEVKVD